MAAHEDYISIPKFLGINQASDGHNTDLKYADGGINFDTRYGGLRPYKASELKCLNEGEPIQTRYNDFHKGHTLAFMIKRWAKLDGVLVKTDEKDHTYAIAATKKGIFYRKSSTAFGDFDIFDKTDWVAFNDPETGEAFYDIINPKFSCVTYEMNYYPPEPLTEEIKTAIGGGAEYYVFDAEDYDYFKVTVDGTRAYYVRKDMETEVDVSLGDNVRLSSPEAPIDCILLSNAEDGFYCIYAPIEEEYDEERYQYAAPLKITKIHVDPENTGNDIHFGAIVRYCERIMGAGIPTDPDKLMYSAPFDFFNWNQNNEIPEDGAGDIQQPNWDGDGFVALEVMGNSLLCIKKHGIWKIQGTDPSMFVFKKQYGEGAIAEGSTQINGYYCYMLSDNSVKVFDGSNCYDLMHGSIQRYLEFMYAYPWKNDAMSAMCDGRYYLLLGDYLIIFDTNENTYNVCDSYKVVSVDNTEKLNEICAIAAHDGHLYALVKKPHGSEDPYGYDVDLHELFKGNDTLPVRWESAWIDLNARNINKSSFSVYLMVEKDASNDVSVYPTTLPASVSVQTEKKTKTKSLNLNWLKGKRVQVNNQGRMFKLILEFPSVTIERSIVESLPSNWQIATGIQVYLEYDYD